MIQILGFIFGWKLTNHINRNGGWKPFAGAFARLQVPAAEPEIENRIRINAMEFNLRSYTRVAKWFLLHAFRPQWRDELPGVPGNLARINLDVIGNRIKLGWMTLGFWAALWAFFAARSHHADGIGAALEATFGTLVLTGLVGPLRWIGAYCFAPFSLWYACRRIKDLQASGDGGFVPIIMHDYAMIASWGPVAFVAAGWLTGARSLSAYTGCVYLALAVIGFLVARNVLSHVPANLFSRNRDLIAVSILARIDDSSARVSTAAAAATSTNDEASDVAKYTDADPCDAAAFRWETAFPAADGRVATRLQPKMTLEENGRFHIDDSIPLRPPTS